jgi:hypothetical protein
VHTIGELPFIRALNARLNYNNAVKPTISSHDFQVSTTFPAFLGE